MISKIVAKRNKIIAFKKIMYTIYQSTTKNTEIIQIQYKVGSHTNKSSDQNKDKKQYFIYRINRPRSTLSKYTSNGNKKNNASFKYNFVNWTVSANQN